MSKIDVASIEGYESMTAEEKIAALEAYEIEVPAPKESDEVVKLKNALNNAVLIFCRAVIIQICSKAK